MHGHGVPAAVTITRRARALGAPSFDYGGYTLIPRLYKRGNSGGRERRITALCCPLTRDSRFFNETELNKGPKRYVLVGFG